MFYTTQWLVERENIRNFMALFDLAADLECLLWLEHTQDDDGYKVVNPILQVASEPIFRLFEERASHRIELPPWHQIDIPEHEVPNLSSPIRMSEISGNLHSVIFEGFLEAAWDNEKLIQKKAK